MSKQFIYCFTENDRENLTKNGFKFICKQRMGDKIAYVFNNDSEKLNFTLDESKYVLDNKLFFQ